MGSFCMVFPTAENAIGWCEEVQNELLKLPWPHTLLEHFAAKELIEDKERAHTTTKSKVLFKGIRIRMGVHNIPSGVLSVDSLTRRLGYKWEDVELVACIAALAHGGQVQQTLYSHYFKTTYENCTILMVLICSLHQGIGLSRSCQSNGALQVHSTGRI